MTVRSDDVYMVLVKSQLTTQLKLLNFTTNFPLTFLS